MQDFRLGYEVAPVLPAAHLPPLPAVMEPAAISTPTAWWLYILRHVLELVRRWIERLLEECVFARIEALVGRALEAWPESA